MKSNMYYSVHEYETPGAIHHIGFRKSDMISTVETVILNHLSIPLLPQYVAWFLNPSADSWVPQVIPKHHAPG
jgi:hypothetical protein